MSPPTPDRGRGWNTGLRLERSWRLELEAGQALGGLIVRHLVHAATSGETDARNFCANSEKSPESKSPSADRTVCRQRNDAASHLKPSHPGVLSICLYDASVHRIDAARNIPPMMAAECPHRNLWLNDLATAIPMIKPNGKPIA